MIAAAEAARQPSAPEPQEQSPTTAARVVLGVDLAFQQDIRRLLDDVGFHDLLHVQVDQMMGPLGDMLKANPQLTPEFVDECLRRMKPRLLDGRLEELTIQEYAKF